MVQKLSAYFSSEVRSQSLASGRNDDFSLTVDGTTWAEVCQPAKEFPDVTAPDRPSLNILSPCWDMRKNPSLAEIWMWRCGAAETLSGHVFICSFTGRNSVLFIRNQFSSLPCINGKTGESIWTGAPHQYQYNTVTAVLDLAYDGVSWRSEDPDSCFRQIYDSSSMNWFQKCAFWEDFLVWEHDQNNNGLSLNDRVLL